MRVEVTEAVWLDESEQFSFAELAELSGLTQSELELLIDCEALVPMRPAGTDPAGAWFAADSLTLARAACRLRRDFDLNEDGLALALTLLGRIRDLESELRVLQARFPRRHG